MPEDIDAIFERLRRSPFVETPFGALPQEIGAGSGNVAPVGWLADNSVVADVIRASAVETEKLAAGAVTAEKIESNTITANEIAAGTITGNEIAANAITSGHIAANTIQASDIAANTITSNEIAANTLTANEIAASAITATELAADSVITNKILAGNVTSSRIELTLSGKNFGSNDGSGSAPGVFFDLETNSGIWRNAAGAITLSTLGNTRMLWGLGTTSYQSIVPSGDNVADLGNSSNRWATVYRVAESSTSDRRSQD